MRDRQNHPADGDAPEPPDGSDPTDPPVGRSREERRRDLLTLDLPLVFGLTVCTVLTIVEATRAVGGNARSWAYTFEWPIIGAFVCWIWFRYRISARRGRSRSSDADTTTAQHEAPMGGSAAQGGGTDSAHGLPGIGRSITGRWRARVAEAEAAYDREHAEALRAWEEYARRVQESDPRPQEVPDDGPAEPSR